MFQTLKPEALQENVFTLLNKDWTLITAGNEEKANTMTASWGGLGILWNKPVATIYVRPQRYTYPFLEAEDSFSLCFFEDDQHDILAYCGAHSGRDEDKIAKCNLHTLYQDGVPYFEEARLVFICKKAYYDDIDPIHFTLDDIEKNYPNHDYHRMYIGEITKVLVKK